MKTHPCCAAARAQPDEHLWWEDCTGADIDCRERREDYKCVGLSLIVVRQKIIKESSVSA